jgi:hypothetical protein
VEIKLESNRVTQKWNNVMGNLVGGDLIENKIYISKEIAIPTQPLRSEAVFDLDIDSENTVLLKKLEDGRLNITFRERAISKKLKAISHFLRITKTEVGRQYFNDLCENLESIIFSYLCEMEEGELFKTSFKEIYSEFTHLTNKYQSVMGIDESYVEGLLYIATSNCAFKWRVGEQVS